MCVTTRALVPPVNAPNTWVVDKPLPQAFPNCWLFS